MTHVCLGYPGHRCGRLIPRGSRCDECQRAMYTIRNQARDPFLRSLYHGAAWRKLADAVVAAADACFYCHRNDAKLTADHVVAVRLDKSRALDPSNLVAACRSCQERRKHDPQWWGVARVVETSNRAGAVGPDLAAETRPHVHSRLRNSSRKAVR